MKTTDDQTEEFVIVDRNDAVIGYRSRYDCHHDKTLIHRSIGLCIFDVKGRILLQQRSLTKDTDPGKWAIAVGGHVQKGESYEQAVQREMKEELGIDIPFALVQTKIFEMDKETEMGALFKGVYNGPFYPDAREVDQVAFFSASEIQEKVKHEVIHLSSSSKMNLIDVGVLQKDS